MGLSTNGQVYQTTVAREDLAQKLMRVAIHKTPFTNLCGHTMANGVYHEWPIDTISKGSLVGKVEGADISFDSLTPPTRIGNRTEIIQRSWKVSETEKAVLHAGYTDRIQYEKSKALLRVMNDIECALLTSSLVTANTTAARWMNGMLYAITTNVTNQTDVTLTEAIFNDMAQTIWEASDVGPSDVFVPAVLARRIDTFTTNNTKFLQADAKTQINTIRVYDGQFEVQKIHKSQYLSGTTANCPMLMIAPEDLRIAWLRKPMTKETAHDADAEGGYVICELTLEYGNEVKYGLVNYLRNL